MRKNKKIISKNKIKASLFNDFFTKYPYLRYLAKLARDRSGGQYSIQGFIFQFKYSVWKLLDIFNQQNYISKSIAIQLEGIEDIDLIKINNKKPNFEHIQVKHSKNKMDASSFWESGVLQNFAEIYLKNPDSYFRIVHNMEFSQGHLSLLEKFCNEDGDLDKNNSVFWNKKFEELKTKQKEKVEQLKINNTEYQKWNWSWSNFNLMDFLNKITFEKVSEDFLEDEINKLVIKKFQIYTGNERQYIQALINLILVKSSSRLEITNQDIVELAESVKNDIAKGPVNPAVQYRWLEPVDFTIPQNKDLKDYFEGKAARPYHISANLPVRRQPWKDKVLNTFEESDATVIRASSGQGKSTLAWQVVYELLQKGWKPYELVWCQDEKEIGNLVTLIESKIKIGECILVVIDGLNKNVSAWGELVNRTLKMPIKLIITSREEDWYNYGTDLSRLILRPVIIEMSKDEAENIYNQFKNAGKIHPSIKNWQGSWEQVADRKLLMEYVYLLTQGEMLSERLSNQIKTLKSDNESKAKIEILRLVSAADLCEIEIPVSYLLKYIEKKVGFKGDPDLCIASLEKEYYIQIKNNYIEGLHPVRSRHLIELLHNMLPIDDTLINLLELIDTNNVYYYCSNAPLLIKGAERKEFLEKLAESFLNRPYSEINKATDGLFSCDAFKNWEENRNSYDQLYFKGAGIFSMDAFPWSNLKILESLKNIAKDITFKKRIEQNLEILSQISPFNPKNSITLIFIEKLAILLYKVKINSNLAGIGRLANWFYKFSQKFPPFFIMTKADFMKAFNDLEIEEGGEIFEALCLTIPELFYEIINENKIEIIGKLKIRTDTLLIEEKELNLYIEYFIESDEEKDVNSQSVSRITKIHSFLPHYKRYQTKGLKISLLGMEMYEKYDQSVKDMPAENIPNFFNINLNKIWRQRIAVMYENQSVYE
jgi:hypothetical protein